MLQRYYKMCFTGSIQLDRYEIKVCRWSVREILKTAVFYSFVFCYLHVPVQESSTRVLYMIV